ncbi:MULTISPECIES: polysaccharide deacetylase family protein [unclassified Brevundimonas]|uniref:polysaccharide deacetylase family protein n=1 Tax=unclassified Brevundimonas TaxID=2622653 RepID=UPI0025C079D5|nr:MULTISPECIES: polysaccharide deacetylase family protein [unclassified Brevundimonas]
MGKTNACALLNLTSGCLCALLFAAGAPEACAQEPSRVVAITFDDLPYAGRIGESPGALSVDDVAALNARVRSVLAEARAPATGFVVEQTAAGLGEARWAVLREWTTGNLTLGNHSYSHSDINQLTSGQIEDEIVRGEISIRPLMVAAGKPLRFVRFPQNHTGDTEAKRDAISAMLSARGYIAAASTIDTSDYQFEAAYSIALAAEDEECATRIREAYLAFSAAKIDYYVALNLEVLGRAPAEIALLHLNQINADTLPELLDLYRARGFGFVSLETAHADPAYASPNTFVSPYGPMWGYRWAKDQGVRVDGSKDSDPPAWLAAYATGASHCGDAHQSIGAGETQAGNLLQHTSFIARTRQ